MCQRESCTVQDAPRFIETNVGLQPMSAGSVGISAASAVLFSIVTRSQPSSPNGWGFLDRQDTDEELDGLPRRRGLPHEACANDLARQGHRGHNPTMAFCLFMKAYPALPTQEAQAW
jgi:hypothetical protein